MSGQVMSYLGVWFKMDPIYEKTVAKLEVKSYLFLDLCMVYWHILTYMYHENQANVGKYNIPMDP